MNSQQIELKLFETPVESIKQSASYHQPLTQDKVTESMSKALTEVLPEKTAVAGKPTQDLKKSLDDLFPEQQYEEKNMQQAKQILGAIADKFSNEQMQSLVSEILYLTESWLDDFERETYNGLTLKEFLHERGGK